MVGGRAAGTAPARHTNFSHEEVMELSSLASPLFTGGERTSLESTHPPPPMHALQRITAVARPLIARVDLASTTVWRDGHEPHTVTLADGRLRVHGGNSYGQLGIVDEHGHRVPHVDEPRYVSVGEPIRELADVQCDSTFVITESGRLLAAGINTLLIYPSAQIAAVDRITNDFCPVPLPAPVHQSTGCRGLLLLETGAVWCYGQRGDMATTTDGPCHAVTHHASAPVVMVAATAFSSFLLTNDGTVYMAGGRTMFGRQSRSDFTPDGEYLPLLLYTVERAPLRATRIYARGLCLVVLDEQGRAYYLGRTPYRQALVENGPFPMHLPTPGPVTELHLMDKGVAVRCRDGRCYMLSDMAPEWRALL